MIVSTAYAASAAGKTEAFWQTGEFWVALAFIVLIGAVFKPVGRAIAAALDMRSLQIKNKIDEAQKLREDAQEKLAEYQRKQRDAMKEAEEIVVHAKAEAKRVAEQAQKDLEESLKRREQQAMDRIAQAEAQAMNEVRALAVDIAIAASRKLLAENLPAAQADKLIEDSIKSLPEKLH